MSTSFKDESFPLDLTHEHGLELDALLARVQMLRDDIITAWRDRGVTLTSGEQTRFHAEIVDTCKLLTDLTLTR
jgi:hypothetical protein